MQTRLGKSWLDLWASAARRLAGEPTEPVAAPDPRDKRFADPEWSSNQYFDFLKQAYLVTADWAKHLVDDAEPARPRDPPEGGVLHAPARQRGLALEFHLHQSGAACAPPSTRTPRTSSAAPTCSPRTSRPAAANCKIRQSDASKFEVGRNLAITPGKVIYQNELMQLIQYAPIDREGAAAPAADRAALDQQVLRARSHAGEILHQLVRRHGLTVFVISWVNPDEHLAAKDFADYMRQGPLEALDVIGKVTGETEVNAIGYCVGGTLLAITLAYMAATERPPHRVGERSSPPRSTSPMPATSRCSPRRGAGRGGRAPDGRARLSRRREDGDRLQPAALATT